MSRPASKAFLKALTESRGPLVKSEPVAPLEVAEVNRPFFHTIFERPKGSNGPWRFGSNGFRSMDEARASAAAMTADSFTTEYRAVRVGDVEVAVADAVAQAIAKERADMRSWLGQKAVEAERESHGVGDRAIVCAGKRSAFKEAADHLKPPKVKGHLKRKRAARAVGK